jgi:hypothetical protein
MKNGYACTKYLKDGDREIVGVEQVSQQTTAERALPHLIQYICSNQGLPFFHNNNKY